MKNCALSIILLTILLSCDRKFRDDFTALDITKIVIEEQSKINSEDYTFFEGNGKIYRAEKSNQIEEYKKLLQSSIETDYCCCPDEHFSISLFNYNDNFNTFYVDTLELKDKIRIFESGYQYSYIVEKKKWKAFLSKINN